MIVYVTEMLRWGSEEDHHYIVGVYSSHDVAEFAGDAEKSWRGGKYEFKIHQIKIDNKIPDEVINYHMQCVPK